MKKHPPPPAFAPAAERNRRAIASALREFLPPRGLVLEVASGTGQHTEYFSEVFPELEWQPTDISDAALESIAARVQAAARPNFRRPLQLDVQSQPWPIARANVIVCINMVHIAPWEASLALFQGAADLLDPSEVLFTYGPYRVNGAHTAPSNAAFDQSLRSRDPEWGVRDIGELQEVALAQGFALEATLPMPTENMSLVWKREAPPPGYVGEANSITK
ncbi:MAG: DUF938 domain-containing protein [Myxococcota bacterium]